MTYTTRFTGPGLDISLSITTVEDFELVERLLAKIRKDYEQQNAQASNSEAAPTDDGTPADREEDRTPPVAIGSDRDSSHQEATEPSREAATFS